MAFPKRIKKKKEKKNPLLIVGCAISYGEIFSVEKGRHHEVFVQMRARGIFDKGAFRNQGFILEDGSFVDRATAKQIGIQSGQVKEEKMNSNILTSEDLW